MRHFIAAWPDPATRIAFAALSEDVRRRIEYGRATQVENLHLTLAFIGRLDQADAAVVAARIQMLHFRPFTWQVDTLGFFKDAGVLWAGSSKTSEPLNRLSRRVRAILDQFDLDYDRRPLSPHVTLLRGVNHFCTEGIAPFSWRIERVALYRSAPAGRMSHYMRVPP